MNLTEENIIVEEKNKSKQFPMYIIKINNDNEHTFEYVINCLMIIFKKSYDDAYKQTLEIHNNGYAIVWYGPKEIGELKLQQVLNFGNEYIDNKTIVSFPLNVQLLEV